MFKCEVAGDIIVPPVGVKELALFTKEVGLSVFAVLVVILFDFL